MKFFANRQEKLQVLLALASFAFASFAAGLIFSRIPRPTVVVLSPEAHLTPQDLHEIMSTSPPPYVTLRGHRRLMANDTDGSSNATNPLGSESPSSSPTIVVDQIFPIIPEVDNSKSSGSSSSLAGNVTAGLVIGMAGCVILAGAAFFLLDNNKGTRTTRTRVPDDKSVVEIDVEEGDTSAGSTSQGESGYWINTTSDALVPYPMLPPMTPDSQQDDLSISRVSTLTASVVGSEGQWSCVVQDKLKAIDSSSLVTELSAEHLVAQDDCALSELMSRRGNDTPSECSSLTSIGRGNSNSTDDDEDNNEEQLLGEKCLDDYNPLDSPYPSFEYTDFEYTPEKSDEEDMKDNDEVSSRVGPVQLEDLINEIPFDNMSQTPSVVRDIYFVPGKGATNTVGVKFEKKHDYPTVISIDDRSPLVGRIFVEDRILSLNDIDAMDFEAEEILSVLESGRMVKLTVQSAELCESDDSESDISTVDLNTLEDPIEV